MGQREDLLEAVRARLERATALQDWALVLEETALAQAEQLAATLHDDETHEIDLPARYLLGWLHWYRCRALPAGQGHEDLTTAAIMFTPLFVNGVQDLPGPLLPVVADQEVPTARTLLEQALGSPDPTLLDVAVELWQRILTATPTDHPDRAAMLSTLGIALLGRSGRTGEQADLDAAVAASQQAVQATPTDHPARAQYLSSLGMALRGRYGRTGEQADLDDAITTGRQAVQATPTDDPDRAARLASLEAALQVRFERTGEQADLDDAITTGRQAVQATPTDDPDRAARLASLEAALQVRFERTGEQADLDDAITTGRQVVQATSTDHPDRALYLSRLGIALLARFERMGTQADLDAAVAASQQAVQAAPTDHPDRAAMLTSLEAALVARSERMGTQADLDDAITTGRQAVQATPTDHPDRAGRLSNLGVALQLRFERTGEQADLDAAVAASQQAVQAAPTDHPDRATMLDSLGTALQLRFQRTAAQADLDDAITTGRQAVQATPTDHPDRAGRLSNLGIALRVRFERTGEQADLDAAVAASQQAVQATPTDHPSRARYLSNLGAALLVRFERSGEQADLNDAITASQQAVQTTPTDHPERAAMLTSLGTALQVRFERTGGAADREAALSALVDAAAVRSAAPSTRIHAARAAGQLAASTQPRRAADLLEQAVLLLPEVAPRHLERPDQQHAIGAMSGLAADAAALALSDTTKSSDQRAVRALRLLEAARAVLLSQTLHTRSDLTELRDQHPELAARFVELRDLLDQPSAPSPQTATLTQGAEATIQQIDDRRRLAEEFTRLLDHIRALDGFASFAQPPAIEELQAQAEHGAVVVFTISTHRSDALLLTTKGVTALELPALTQDAVIDQIKAFHQALHDTTDPHADRIGAQAQIRQILAWLWENATKPVLTALGHHHPPAPGQDWSRVWWAPGGLLGLLPIHAAGHHTRTRDDPTNHTGISDPTDHTVMDRVISSYTPTIGALHHARRHASTPPTTTDQSLIVAMPTTPDLPHQGKLPNVLAEATLLRARLPHPILLTEPDAAELPATAPADIPSTGNVVAHLKDCTIAHFACHGYTDPIDPSNSRLLLHDHSAAPFTVAALASISLNHARLAYLSACSTAFTADTRLLDEAIHLASAFQLAGFPHVIGTLWPIHDDIAVTIANDFYTTLTKGHAAVDTNQAAFALHQAVRTARNAYRRTPSLWAAHIHAGA